RIRRRARSRTSGRRERLPLIRPFGAPSPRGRGEGTSAASEDGAADEDGDGEGQQVDAVAGGGGEDLGPHAAVARVGVAGGPAQGGHEGEQREQQRGDVEQPPLRVARLSRVDPEQHRQDQEPGREQHQRQVRHGGELVHALASSAARNASSAAWTSAGSTPSPRNRSLPAAWKPSRLSAASRWPASRGDSKPGLSSSTRSPSTSLKWTRPSASRYCLNAGTVGRGRGAGAASRGAPTVPRSRRPTASRSCARN